MADRKTFPQIGAGIGDLVEAKNAAYGSSFAVAGDFLRLLFPAGVPADRFDDALLLVRIFDKQMLIAIDQDAFGESPYQDIAGYGILGVHLHQQKKEKDRTWPGIASADAENQSKAQPASADRNTSATTTTSVSATNGSGPSPRRVSCCAPRTADASAPTATEAAKPSAADPLRQLRNDSEFAEAKA